MSFRFFFFNDFAEMWGVSRITIYQLISPGQLRPTQIGRLTRFSEQEIQRFLNSETMILIFISNN
jgi:excisionase family DNA binding protein